MSNSATTSIQRQDNQILHPWEDFKNSGANKRTVIADGEGIYIHDSDGHKLLDAPAGMWCINIGHRRQEMADAIAEQVMRLSYVSPWSLTSTPAAELAEKLAEISPGDLNHVFYTTGGSTAVDSALRFVTFRNNVRGQPEKKHVISRTNAYHGSTYLAASASGKSKDKNFLDFKDDTFHHIADPSMLNKPETMPEADYCSFHAGKLEQKILDLGPEKVAAFIAEPIMASGGVIIAPKGYHAACLAVCKKHDVIYISDEVVTGFGRLGHFFASEAVFDIVPDIIISAKGLTSGYVPLGAFLVSDRLLKSVRSEDPSIVFSNGFTYSGHPVACAAALKNIEIMEREKILDNVRKVSPYFQSRLAELNDIPIVKNVRGMGLMACVDCTQSTETGDSPATDGDIGNRFYMHCQNLGLLFRPIGDMCVMSPPLIINEQQIDELVGMLRKGIELTMADINQA